MTVSLYPTWTLGDLDLTSYPFAVEFGGDHGAPETVSELVTSMLADGDLVRQTRHGNREVSIVVIVEGTTLGDLAENEATLRAECTKPSSLLTFQPGDFDSPASVFEVLSVSMRHARDDDHESHLLRRWELTLACAPFARSAEMTEIDALVIPGTEVTTLVNNASSATNWLATYYTGGSSPTTSTAAPTAAGTYVVAQLSDAVAPTVVLSLGLTPIDMTSTRYLRVTAWSHPGVSRIDVQMDGVWYSATPVLSVANSDGTTSYFIDTSPGVMLSALRIVATAASAQGRASVTVQAHDVTRTNTLAQTTPRQSTRVLEPGGTERTPASIQVASANGTDPLGLTIVHTCPEDGSGYSPPLRRWRIAGNAVTADSSTFSGAYEPIEPSAFVAAVPQSALPLGGYLLAARLYSATPATVRISWAVYTEVNSVNRGLMAGETMIDFPIAGWQTANLAMLTLPLVRALTGSVTQIHIQASGADLSNTILDEAWLFRMDDDCALTIVNDDTAHLWLDSPDVSSPVPLVWTGDIPDRSDAHHPGASLIAMGRHVLMPTGTAVFTATQTNNAKSSARFYRRWHSNAAG